MSYDPVLDRQPHPADATIAGLRAEIAGLRAEIARLQDAKRRALAIADERSRENVGLRAALKPIAKIHLWRDIYTDGPDIVTDYKLTFVTPDQIREARALCASEQKDRS